MFKQIIILIILNLGFSQDKIVIYHNFDDSKMTKFEKELVTIICDLYLKKNDKTTVITFRKIFDFENHIANFKNNHEKKTLYISIDLLSITKERLRYYDVTETYMPNKYAFLAKKEIRTLSKKKCAYLKGSTISKITKKIASVDPVKLMPFETMKERNEALFNNEVDLIISDYVDSWTYNLNVIKEIDYLPKDYCAIFMVKDNPYNHKFIKIANYYLGSLAYYKLIKKHFGLDAVEYFKQNRKSKKFSQ